MSQKLFQQVGGRVRIYRKLAKLTQERLAEKADLSVHYLSRIETGGATPTLESLERIAQALGVQIGELFQFRQGEEQEVKELLQQINRFLRHRTPQEVRMVKHIIELLPPAKRT